MSTDDTLVDRPGAQVVAVTSWAFDDGLIQSYTLPYLRMVAARLGPGGCVHLITQEPAGSRWLGDVPDGGAGIRVVPHPWAPVSARAAGHLVSLVVRLVRLAAKRDVVAVHAFGTPAGLPALVAATVLRRPLVVDSFEPHADAMVENGTWRAGGVPHRVLSWVERRLARRAWAVVATTARMREYARDRLGAVPARFQVKPACVDLDAFTPASTRRDGDDVVGAYAGRLGGIYLDDEVFDIVAAAVERWGDRFRFDMITDAPRDEIVERCRRAGVDPAIVRSRRLPHHEVPEVLRTADFAVNPVKPVPSKRYCTSVKDGEYWASGLPVLITKDISDDSAVIAERRIGAVLDDLSPAAVRRALAEIDALLDEPERTRARRDARAAAEQLRGYAVAERAYDAIYGPRR